MENLKICEALTKLDAKGIKKAFKDFANFDVDARNEIFKMQRTHFHSYSCDGANGKRNLQRC